MNLAPWPKFRIGIRGRFHLAKIPTRKLYAWLPVWKSVPPYTKVVNRHINCLTKTESQRLVNSLFPGGNTGKGRKRKRK